MFACLYLPPPVKPLPVRAEGSPSVAQGFSPAIKAKGRGQRALVHIARDFSPRVEVHGDATVTLDIGGLGRLIGEPRAIGEELRRTTADAGLRVHIAVAATTTAAILLAQARAGLTVVARGEEAATLAPLPLRMLTHIGFGLQASGSRPDATGLKSEARSPQPDIESLLRWGLRTLGDLAALPAQDLSARLGPSGLRWQRWARGEDMRPLVSAAAEDVFEESLDLEWPIEELEPLSFVFARLFEPLCDRLERRDRGAVVLRVTLTLVNDEIHSRVVELPAPMRDARVLRTLALLDLESNPPPAAVDRVSVAVDVAEGRVLQFGLLARALPTDTLATLMARLGALMGSDRIGSPALVDTYRPGAFTMGKFDPPLPNPQSLIPHPGRGESPPASVLRRFRSPVPARITVEHGRPVTVATDRRGCGGGRVERCDGPWRSSGDWWKSGWHCDEWDVTLHDGATYRISHAHDVGEWFVNGVVD
jgi:protein ImuB